MRPGVVIALLVVLAACGGTSEDARKSPRSVVAEVHLAQPRAVHRATRLADGTVLITGGCTRPGCEGFDAGRRAELFDPAQDRFTNVDDLGTARADHTATLLSDGRVLIAGGFDESGTPLNTTELFDPGSGTFSSGPPLNAPRAAHVATKVGDTVVLVGGTEDASALATT